MKSLVAGFVVVTSLTSGHPAVAQDVLAGLSGDYRALHGHRVDGSGPTMVVLADDGTTSSVDTSAMAIPAPHPIERGQAVTLAVKPGGAPNTFIAGRIAVHPADPSTGRTPKRPFDSVLGTVEAFEDSQIIFRTADGLIVHADASAMPGRAAVRVNERGVLTYERGVRHVTALWLVQEAR